MDQEEAKMLVKVWRFGPVTWSRLSAGRAGRARRRRRRVLDRLVERGYVTKFDDYFSSRQVSVRYKLSYEGLDNLRQLAK